MGQPSANPLPLSVHRACVVAFHAEVDFRAGRVIGRVEHVVSGRATSFQSQETLLAFRAQRLREVHDGSSQL
jgi:S-adenosylmethionine synthetase